MCLRRTSRSDDESATVPVAPKEGFAAAPTRTIPAPACSAQRTLKLFCYYYMQSYHLYCATLRTNGHGACASHDRRQPNYQQQQSTATWRPGNPTQCRSSSHVGAWSAIPTNTSAVRTAAGPKPPSHSWDRAPEAMRSSSSESRHLEAALDTRIPASAQIRRHHRASTREPPSTEPGRVAPSVERVGASPISADSIAANPVTSAQ